MSDGLDPYWLTLVGISGTGKTMLAKAIVKYINLYGRTIYNRTIANSFGDQDSRRIYSYAQSGPLFVAWREICPVDKDARGRLSTASSDWFKCVDELKAQVGEKVTVDGEPGIQPKPFEIQACGDLLDERLRKWTVITTNMQRRAIARFWDVRIASRLMRDGAVICDLSDTRDFGIRREIALKNA